MDAWGKSVNAGDKVMMLADGSATFAKALGVELDLAAKGLGVRSRRYGPRATCLSRKIVVRGRAGFDARAAPCSSLSKTQP